MSRSSVRTIGTWLIFLSVQGAVSAQSPSPTQPDKSDDPIDPRAAVTEFYAALINEDVERASQFVLQPEKMKDWIQCQTDLSASFKRWNKVVADKLGDQATSVMMPNPIQLVADRSHDVDVRVKGDVAEFPVNNKNPLTLRRVDNVWKLDIFSGYERPESLKLLRVANGEDALLLVTLRSREDANMINSIADDIDAGRLTTPEEIRQRVRFERGAINERVLHAFRQATQKEAHQPE